jgi:hypothetical protein
MRVSLIFVLNSSLKDLTISSGVNCLVIYFASIVSSFVHAFATPIMIASGRGGQPITWKIALKGGDLHPQ